MRGECGVKLRLNAGRGRQRRDFRLLEARGTVAATSRIDDLSRTSQLQGERP